MKHRKLMAMLLSLVIALTFIPAVAFADEEAAEGTEPAATELLKETAQAETPKDPETAEDAVSETVSDGLRANALTSTYYLQVGDDKVDPDVATPVVKPGWSYDGGSKTLTLNGIEMSGGEPKIDYYGFNLTIVLEETNSVYCIRNVGEGLQKNNELTIKGSGTVTVQGEIYAKKITISSGTVTVQGENGISASEAVNISGGTVTVAGDDGIGTPGAINISGGTINLNNEDIGINAGTVIISGGNITSGRESSGYCGIFATNIIIKGGNIDIRNRLLGIHAFDNIEISGGSVNIATLYTGINADKGIIISGNKTRVETASISIDEPGLAMQAGTGIEIRNPLYIKVPVNGKVERQRIYQHDAYTILMPDRTTIATHVVIEPKSETNNILIATAKEKGKESIDLSWNKLDGVDGYDVFFSRCNTKKQKYTCEYAGSTDGSSTTWSKAALKRRTPYKMYVMAYVMSGDSKTYVAKSPTVHAYTGGGSGRYTNPKSVKVKKSKVTVKKNKTYKIKASVRKLRKGKKLINGRHARKLRYLSSNTSVATVSRYGKIKGVAPGTCDVYVLAVNGSYKKVAVTVK